MHWKTPCCAALAAVMMAASAPPAAALSGVSGWASGEVGRAESAGLAPDAFGSLPARGSITRAEFCAVALRLFESGTGRVAEQTGAQPFTDTADPQVAAANALGLVSGRGGGVFVPDAPVTRQELCVMLGNVLRAASGTAAGERAALSQYRDADEVAAWAADDMAAMAGAGVISGVAQPDGTVTLSPQSTATREQSLMMAVRFLNAYDLGGDVGEDSGDEPAAPAQPTEPSAPAATPETGLAGQLTAEQKQTLVFGANEPGYDTPEQAEAAMTEITVPVWRLREDGGKTAGSVTLTVNAALASRYQAVFEEIFNGSEKFPIHNAGSYSWRSNTRSEHRWGTAIDLNWEENMECSIDENGQVTQITSGSYWKPGEDPYSIPADGDVVRAFKKYGFAWGGDAWSKKRDYMHFSYFGR